MIAFLLAAAVTVAQPCTTVQPGADWVCVDGGWRPANQVPQPPPVPPYQPAPDVPFLLGHRYTRGTTDVRISGTGQLPDGVSVLFALCLETGDGCYARGEVRMFLSNATAKGWTHLGPY
jgi:hypothetical protein